MTPTGIHLSSRRTNPLNVDISTRDTVYQMIALARTYASHPAVQLALRDALSTITPPLENQTYKGIAIARAVFWYVKRKVEFVEDDVTMKVWGIDPMLMGGRDLLITPDLLLSMPNPVGDCDDFSTLIASMMIAANGLVWGKGWFVTIAADRANPKDFSHVYVKWNFPGENPAYMYLDGSHGLYPGWETNQIYRKEEWKI